MSNSDKLKAIFKKEFTDYLPAKFNEYALAYAYGMWWDSLKEENFVLKGAFNLYKNFNYKRHDTKRGITTLTTDIDISILSISLDDARSKLLQSFKDFNADENNTFYLIDVDDIKFEETKAKTTFYTGFNIKTKVYLKDDLQSFWLFALDVAVEEMEDYPFEVDKNKKKFYSITNSLAEKFVSMIFWGSGNRRRKDFIDLSVLFDDISDYTIFYDLVKRYIEVRNIDEVKLQNWKDNWEIWIDTFIDEFKLNPYIKEIIGIINTHIF